jgi:predicted phosphate transport protein (TIGR00153 family)
MFGPKNTGRAFFEAFSAHAAKTVEAAHLLVELVQGLAGGNEAVERGRALYARIKAAESAADSITHETIRRLHETWITPFDRNDIHSLITRMDDVLDMIEAAAERVVLFQVTDSPPEAAALTHLLARACEALAKAVALLDTMRRATELLELCVEVNVLENEADALHRRAIADLFSTGNDPLRVMKWRDILDNLESATDRCEDVANILEGVVLEYA